MKDAPKTLKMEDLDQSSDAFQIDSYKRKDKIYVTDEWCTSMET